MRRTFAPLLFLLLAACSPFHEVYLFRAGSPEQANYYRVRIDGFTAFTSSQYAAGLYDAEAVDSLFGELTGPGKHDFSTGGQQQPQQPQEDDQDDTDTDDPDPQPRGQIIHASGSAKAQTLSGKSTDDKKFVFFLSSNNDAFINEIDTYVRGERMQTAVLSLLLKDDLKRLEKAKAASKDTDSNVETLTAAMEAQAQRLGTGESATAGQVRAAALGVLQVLARRSGTTAPRFADAEEAETWLKEHPQAFQFGGEL